MEWDIGMPWYRDIRTVHVVPGGDYGYRNGSGKLPAWAYDSLPPLRDVGRGSPVGVEFYQSHVYPTAIHDALLEADWSRGRLLYTPLTRKGASYVAAGARTELVHGEPLNITDVEVGPDGLVYFTTGGRTTEGGVCRVTYSGPKPPMAKLSPLMARGAAAAAALELGPRGGRQDQGRDSAPSGRAASRSWRAIAPPRATIGRRRSTCCSGTARRRRWRCLTDLMREADADVRAAAVFAAGVQGAKAAAVAAAGLKDLDPLVQRRAAEALVRMGQSPARDSLAPVADIYALLGSPDRFVRFAGRLALQRTARAAGAIASWPRRTPFARSRRWSPTSSRRPIAPTCCRSSIGRLRGWADRTCRSICSCGCCARSSSTAIEAARLTQPAPPANVRRDGQVGFQAQTITAGDIDAARLQQVHQKLIGRFPSTDERLTAGARRGPRVLRPAGRVGEDPRGHAAGRHQSGAADPPAQGAAPGHAVAGRRSRRRR